MKDTRSAGLEMLKGREMAWAKCPSNATEQELGYLFSPFGRPKMSKPAGSTIRSCLGKAKRLTFPGLKPWAVFRGPLGRRRDARQIQEAPNGCHPEFLESYKPIYPSASSNRVIVILGSYL